MNHLLDEITIESILKNPNVAATSPKILPKLQGILQDPNASGSDMSDLIKLDDWIASHVIRTSNSSFYGLNQKVSDLLSAINAVGSKEIYNITAQAIAKRMVMNPIKVYNSTEKELWVESVSFAKLMEEIAKITSSDPNIAYTLGLFHAVGKTAIGNTVRFPQNSVLALAEKKKYDLIMAEEEAVKFNHATLGSKLLESWNFIDAIYIPIRYQYVPKECSGFKIYAIMLNICHSITNEMGLNTNWKLMEFQDATKLGKPFNINSEKVAELKEFLNEELAELKGDISALD